MLYTRSISVSLDNISIQILNFVCGQHCHLIFCNNCAKLSCVLGGITVYFIVLICTVKLVKHNAVCFKDFYLEK